MLLCAAAADDVWRELVAADDAADDGVPFVCDAPVHPASAISAALMQMVAICRCFIVKEGMNYGANDSREERVKMQE